MACLMQLEAASSSILVRTEDGHTLLDPYQGFTNAAPRGYEMRIAGVPPVEPYDGMPESPSSKSRKRKRELSTNEQLNQEHHEDVCTWLQDAIDKIRESWLYKQPSSWSPGYSALRICGNLPQDEFDLAGLVASTSVQASDTEVEGRCLTLVSTVSHMDLPPADLCNKPILNISSETCVLSLPKASFAIPSRSGFLLSDLAGWHQQLSALNFSYDLVLLDPPWRSKSVRRSDSYDEMDLYDLFKIDLPNLLLKQVAKKPVLVAVWVTNHPKHRRFIKEKLLPDWGVSQIVDWYWVKITQNAEGADVSHGGLPVWSLEGPSPRRCYEGLILGYHNPFHLPVPSALPDKQAFLSVPLTHSRKPLVLDLLRPYLPKYPYVLEFFARFAPTGSLGKSKKGFWMSVGNEAIKFNQTGVHLEQKANHSLPI